MRAFKFTLFLSITFLACFSEKNDIKITKEDLNNTWQLANIEDEAGKSGNAKADLQNSSALISAVQDGIYYAFFTDGTYGKTQASVYETGKWEFLAKEKQVILQPSGQNPQIFEITAWNSEKKQIRLQEKDKSVVLIFKQIPRLKDELTDPFHPQNNQWRIKATAAESIEQVKMRLKNLLQHYIYLLEASEERKDNVINFGQSVSFIQIYSGGIGIKENSVDNPAWKNIFFTPENELVMNVLFVDLLQKSGDSQMGSSGNWVKDDIVLLKALYADMDKFYKNMK